MASNSAAPGQPTQPAYTDMHTQYDQPQPTSLVMGAREMLEEMEDVNVLGECSEPSIGSNTASYRIFVPTQHLW
jgi:hypothetical protein